MSVWIMVYEVLSNKKFINLKMIKYFVLKRKGLQEKVESSVATSFHMAYNKRGPWATSLTLATAPFSYWLGLTWKTFW